jgi:FtsP/CotA-like multicopper oxidase with cupredoxin domain
MRSLASSFIAASLLFWQNIDSVASRRVEFTLVVRHEVVDTLDPVSGETISRLGTFVNGTYPGPTLEVQLGDDVEVKVVNEMTSSSLTMHFHGQHMVNTFFHDGVHGITQCDISPHDSYIHRFKAEPAGTFIYHSHMPFQPADGGAYLYLPSSFDVLLFCVL